MLLLSPKENKLIIVKLSDMANSDLEKYAKALDKCVASGCRPIMTNGPP